MTAWRRVARSSSPSSSCSAVTVTVCGAFQSSGVKVSVVGSGATSGLPLATETPTPLVQPVGRVSSTSVYVPWFAASAPGSSSRDRLVRETTTAGAVGVTGSEPLVTSLAPEWAAASTVTDSVAAASTS